MSLICLVFVVGLCLCFDGQAHLLAPLMEFITVTCASHIAPLPVQKK